MPTNRLRAPSPGAGTLLERRVFTLEQTIGQKHATETAQSHAICEASLSLSCMRMSMSSSYADVTSVTTLSSIAVGCVIVAVIW